MIKNYQEAIQQAYKRGLSEYEADPRGKGRDAHIWALARKTALAKRSDGSKDKDLFHRIPPRPAPQLTKQPIHLDTILAWINEINDAMMRAGLERLNLSVCHLADHDHGKDPRVFAHTNHKKRTICVSKVWLHLPIQYAFGILVHEAGHEAAFQAWGNDREEAADTAAFDLLGWKISYDGPSFLQVARRA